MTRHPRTVMPDEGESLLAQAAFWKFAACCLTLWALVGYLGWRLS